jgi:hypothetical protein
MVELSKEHLYLEIDFHYKGMMVRLKEYDFLIWKNGVKMNIK